MFFLHGLLQRMSRKRFINLTLARSTFSVVFTGENADSDDELTGLNTENRKTP